jgi:ribosomal protein S11
MIKKKKRQKKKENVQAGIANVTSTFNNTIITITDFV